MLQLPLLKQSKNYCGPFSLKMVLSYYGIEKDVEDLAHMLHATHETGCEQTMLPKVAQELGFEAFYKQNSSLDEVKKYVAEGVPVIVEWFSPEENGHYSPVVGFENDEIILADPLLGDLRRLKTDQFVYRWFELDNYPPENQANFALREIIVVKPKK